MIEAQPSAIPYVPTPCPAGFSALTAAAKADVRRRLFRCGLAASLDHTLRLAYSAQDRNAEVMEGHVMRATVHVWCFLEAEIMPLLPPTAAHVSSVLDQGGGSSSTSSGGHGSSSGGGGSSGEERHHLGLVHTLSKRAAVVGRELEAMSRAPTPSTRGLVTGDEGPDLLSEVAPLLLGLNTAMGSLQDGIAAAARTAQGAAAAGPSGGEQGTSGPEEAVMELARETLALAARAACDLGASLAWELARDATAEAAAVVGAEGEAEVKMDGRGNMAAGVVVSAANARTAAAERVATDTEGDQLEGREAEEEEEGKGGSARTVDEEGDDNVEARDGPASPRHDMKKGVGEVLYRMMYLCREPSPLCPAQLLACQPHRLLAAACALAAALPNNTGKHRSHLRLCVANIVTILSAREELSGCMRCWLAPPPGVSYSSAGICGEPYTCAGCLAKPVHAAMQHGLWLTPTLAVPAVALLKVAAGEVTLPQGAPCYGGGGASGSGSGGGGGGGVSGAADAAFQQCAKAMAEYFQVMDDQSVYGTQEAVLPDGSWASRLQAELGADGRPPPSAPSGALPPPLALPPSLARALPRLRVCSNPRCGNFGGQCEDALPFKQCGGCRAVRYCGKDCQGAHWREVHKSECKALRLEKGDAVA